MCNKNAIHINGYELIPVEFVEEPEEETEFSLIDKLIALEKELEELREEMELAELEAEQEMEYEEIYGSEVFDPMPLRILKSGDRTIVFWEDGDKTIVKRASDEEDNDYVAFTAALGIKSFGSNNALKKAIAAKTVYQTEKKKKKGKKGQKNERHNKTEK